MLDCRLMTGIFSRRSFWTSALLSIVSAAWNVAPANRLAAQAGDTALTLDKAIVDAFRWRSIGPDRGGRTIAVSGVKGRPREAYFGAVGGGLWKTTDAGMT